MGRPLLTQAGKPSTFEVSAIDESGRVVPTTIAGEHPLTLYLDKRELVTLMTLGAAPEHLALGYLRNQRLLSTIDEVAAVQVDWDTNAVAVTTRAMCDDGIPIWSKSGAGADAEERLARRTVTSGCGQGTMFGDLLETLDDAALPAQVQQVQLSQDVLYRVMDRVRRHESVYKRAGAVHGCALCANTGDDRGDILRFVEDVGRHNAVDAIAGWMWLEGISGADKIFYTTGRLTSEMVIKCAQIGVPFLLSRSGLTQMGYELAVRLGITMIGRCQGKHYLLLTGSERFLAPPAPLALA